MRKVYISHPTNIDFKVNLYEPLRKLEGFEFVFPHNKSTKSSSSKETIKKCSAMIADVSVPSYGVGIEIGWADSFNIPIIFIHSKGSNLSKSLKIVSQNFIEYNETAEDIIPKLGSLLKKLSR